MTTVRTILAVVAGVATLASTTVGDSIELRRSIRREATDRPVVLQDIAVLKGEHANSFASIEIVGAADLPADRTIAVPVGDVRRRLDAAGASWARIDLTGGSVRIRPALVAAGKAAVVPTAPQFRAVADASADGEESAAMGRFAAADDLLAGPEGDLRATIARLILDDLATAGIEREPGRVQLSIDPDALARIPGAAVDGVVKLRGSGAVDRVDAAISYRTPDGRRRQVLTPVEVRVMRLVPIADRRLARNRPLRGLDLDFRLEPRPCRVSEPMVRPESMMGRKLVTTIREGDRITVADLEPEIVVHKGDRVVVQSRAGGYLLSREMEAGVDGALGDSIVCHEPGRRGRGGSVTAVIVEPGVLEIR